MTPSIRNSYLDSYHNDSPTFELIIDENGKKKKYYIDNVVTHHGGSYPQRHMIMQPLDATWSSSSQTSLLNFDSAYISAQITARQVYSNISNIDYPYDEYSDRYLKPPREFNKYINASDMMQDFIRFLKEEKVDQDDIMDIPIEHFIKWLVIKACEQDKVEPNVVLELPKFVQPRCLGCNQFMNKGVELPLCDEKCAQLFYNRKKEIAA